jgi:hypothetical protein
MNVHSIIYYEDIDDNPDKRKYYTTNEDYNHSVLCDMVDYEDLKEIKESEIKDYNEGGVV